MTVWHEDDELWDTAVGWMLRERAEKAPEEIDLLLELTGVRPPGSVLDSACGVGRHSVELARQGFAVTAVDRTSSFLAEAARAAESEELDIEFVEEDMRRFRRPEAFDVAVNLLTSFGYFEDPADDARAVRNRYESLKEGGIVVFDLMGKEVLASIFQARDWKETNGDLWPVLEGRRDRPGNSLPLPTTQPTAPSTTARKRGCRRIGSKPGDCR